MSFVEQQILRMHLSTTKTNIILFSIFFSSSEGFCQKFTFYYKVSVGLDSLQKLHNTDNAFRDGGLPTIERYPGLSIDVLLVRIFVNMVLHTFYLYFGHYWLMYFCHFWSPYFFVHILAIIGLHRIRFHFGYSTKTDRILSAILFFLSG